MTSVVFDLDGVLYRGSEMVPGAAGCVRKLRAEGARVGFLTNNSSRSRKDIVEVLAGYGILAEQREVMTSGEAAARHLIAEDLRGKRAFVLGGDGLVETLRGVGFEVDTTAKGPPCDLVVIGWDRSFTFEKIARAQKEVLENNARLIATNADAMFPAKKGRLLPGAGAMVAAVERATGREAEVIGKPNTISLRYLLVELGSMPDEPPESVWVVGDRIDTDIACGISFGARTVCVTTGITDRFTAEAAPPERRPEFVIDSLSELPELIFGESAEGAD